MLNIISKGLAVLTIGSQIFIILGLLDHIFFRARFMRLAGKFSGSIYMILAFIIALTSMLGSLFYSQIMKFPPCDLCWFQRIFMYPQAIILGIALIKKDKHIIDYCLALSGIGLLFSIYHNYIIYQASKITMCTDSIVSCTTQYLTEYGYVNIPVMALTAFILIIGLLSLQRQSLK